ncbi:hypothetical protein N0V95_009392 [Ascochyta clinopodiicola]|nr:hypothetical protein N0V95_009392 [Ascochyta clinopodiicola]
MTAGARAATQVDASAHATATTLNYALGTRHIKPWMTMPANAPAAAPSTLAAMPASSSVERSSAPTQQPSLDVNKQRHATHTASSASSTRPANAPSVERLPSSNSTSPQLANMVTDPHRDYTHDNAHITVFPSPTPSEEDTTTQPLSAPKRPLEPDASTRDKRPRLDHARQAPTPQESSRSPDLPRRPSAPQTQRPRVSFGQTSSHIPPHYQHASRQMVSPQLVQAAQHWGHPPNSPSNSSTFQDRLIAKPPPAQMHANPVPYSQAFGNVPSHNVAPSQRRPSNHGDWYSLQSCAQILNTFRSLYSSHALNSCDTQRLQVLDQAIDSHDWAYVTLHQYYCLLTCSPQSLPLKLRRNGSLTTAYGLIREVLLENAFLSPPVINFFCAFPYHVDHMAATWPAGFQRAEHAFSMFVSYSPVAVQLKSESERRRLPPSPCEMDSCFIASVVFQHLLLRHIIRTLWAGYPDFPVKRQFEDRLVQAWDSLRLSFQQRRPSRQGDGREQAEHEFRAWSTAYTQHSVSFQTLMRSEGFQQLDSLSPPARLQQQRLQQQPQAGNTPTEDLTMSRRLQQQPPQSSHTRIASQVRPSSSSRQTTTPLLPQPGRIQPQQRIPNPSRFGLHQAHARSPVITAADLTSPVYYFWQGFVCKPQRLFNPNTKIEKMTFSFSAKEMEFLANAIAGPAGAPDQRCVDKNHKTIRLRCVKWPSHEPPTDHLWAVAETSWIPYSYFTFNESSLQLRKKLHHGKDLPVDLTGLVRVGENTLEVSVMGNADDTTHRNYLVAVEFLGVTTQATIMTRCHDNRIPAEKTVDDIKRKLCPSGTDDDDIALVESTLTINLRDPFSASRICGTPVRSRACLHNECFDLDTFLETRPRKGNVSAHDQWRCPICRADARPHDLVVDEFLVEVRDELERRGLLETRAIVVDKDGSWKPKAEERDPNGVQDHDTPEPDAAYATTATNRSKLSVSHEVIDLDSD